MAEKADCIVIGAGVVGLAVARELAMRGHGLRNAGWASGSFVSEGLSQNPDTFLPNKTNF